MTITTHVAVGALIGVITGTPWLGFIAGLLSHFILDAIPHGDTNLAKKYRLLKQKKAAITYGTTDAFIAIYIILVIYSLPLEANNFTLSAAIAGSILPDFLTAVYDFAKIKYLRPFIKFHFSAITIFPTVMEI